MFRRSHLSRRNPAQRVLKLMLEQFQFIVLVPVILTAGVEYCWKEAVYEPLGGIGCGPDSRWAYAPLPLAVLTQPGERFWGIEITDRGMSCTALVQMQGGMADSFILCAADYEFPMRGICDGERHIGG